MRLGDGRIRRHRRGRRRRRPDVRHPRRPARAARAAAGSRRQGRQEDPDLGRRALQFHQPRQPARSFPVGQPAFLQIGAGALHPARFHRPGREAPHRLAREDAGPALLRRLGAADRGHAAGRMRGRRRRCAVAHRITGIEKADRFHRRRPTAARSPRRRWCWRPAGCRSPRWARPASRTTSRDRFGLALTETRPAPGAADHASRCPS